MTATPGSRDIGHAGPDPPLWWARAEHRRREKERRLRRDAVRRLRRIERTSHSALPIEHARRDPWSTMLDSDRLAAPLLERLGVRGRIQLLLWAATTIVLGVALMSFFSAPLMELKTAMSAVVVGAMLILSYVM